MRTTSSIEALNSTIQRTFPDSSNIFKFIQNLSLFDAIKSSDLYQLTLETGMNAKKKRFDDQQRHEKIDFCSKCLKNEELNVFEFLSLMADKRIKAVSDGKLIYIAF